mgnify:CR=1 FL=1
MRCRHRRPAPPECARRSASRSYGCSQLFLQAAVAPVRSSASTSAMSGHIRRQDFPPVAAALIADIQVRRDGSAPVFALRLERVRCAPHRLLISSRPCRRAACRAAPGPTRSRAAPPGPAGRARCRRLRARMVSSALRSIVISPSCARRGSPRRWLAPSPAYPAASVSMAAKRIAPEGPEVRSSMLAAS